MKLKTKPKKLVKISYSYFVSISPDWIRLHGLKKGDSLQGYIQENGDLVLKPFYNEVKNDTTQ